MWVFGYGSLVWNPGFSYQESRVGHIKGYVRRFWQGNDFHRGTPSKIGRVATLVEDEDGTTWGRAFLLDEKAESSLAFLDSRENKHGGYSTTIVTFYPRDPKEEPFPALLYVAMPDSRLYAGTAPISQVAEEIAEARGACGPNAEYLLRLARFMREEAPHVWDEHLYHLEHLVRAKLKEQNVCADDLLGGDPFVSTVPDTTKFFQRQERQKSPDRSQDFASKVPSRKFKCLDL